MNDEIDEAAEDWEEYEEAMLEDSEESRQELLRIQIADRNFDADKAAKKGE